MKGLNRFLSGAPTDALALVAAARRGEVTRERDTTETPEQYAARVAAQTEHRRASYEARLPWRYRGASIDDIRDVGPDGLGAPEPGGALRVHRFARGEGQTLIMSGKTPGVGKTHGGYAVTNHVARDLGQWVMARHVGDLVDEMRPGGDGDTFDHAVSCDLLFVDDLGAERGTEWASAEILRILDTRTREGRRLVVATNLDGEGLYARYDHRIVDRLFDGLVPVRYTGKTRRKPLPL